MTAERWQKLELIFQAALERPASEHAAFLSQACGDDLPLKVEAEKLLAAFHQANGFLETPAADSLALAKPSTRAAGEHVAHYEILSLLGAGGMGEVYLAYDPRLERQLAVKLLPARFSRDADWVQRFMREARATSALNHPNILTIYEIGEDAGTHFIAAEHINGQTLRQKLATGRLSVSECLRITTQIAAALSAAHEAGIIHRDIKPENVMVRPDSLVKVLDFGLAKPAPHHTPPASAQATLASSALPARTDPALLLGTLAYLSPEQANHQALDARTDIFSLGIVLYEMATGTRPFHGTDLSAWLTAITQQTPTLTKVPPVLAPIIARALAKEPAARYQSAAEICSALQQAEHTFTAPPEKAQRKLLHSAAWPALIALLSLVLASFYFWRARQAQEQATLAAVRSVAVLPFKPVNAEAHDEDLELGLADTLITKLSRIRPIAVRPTSAIRQYAAVETDSLAAGRTLRVDAVLEGSIQRDDQRTRVSLRLVRSSDGQALWAATLDENTHDLFAVQDAVANKVTAALAQQLSTDERRQLQRHATENREAYRQYLQGRLYWDKRTTEDLHQAIAHFEQASLLDPLYAPAYVGLADAYALLNFYSGVQIKEAFPRAKAAAQKALALDDTLAEAHATLAYVKCEYEWDWAGAEAEFRRAIELKPNYATAHQWYAEYLFKLERFSESQAEIERAAELDPLSHIINAELGSPDLYRRAYDQAVVKYQQALALHPNFSIAVYALATCYEQKGLYQQALVEYHKIRSLRMGQTGLGYVYGVTGRRAESLRIIRDLLTQAEPSSSYNIARIYAGLGEVNQALAYLQKAYNDRDERIAMLKVDPKLDRLRADPRFAALLLRAKL